jgi:hypothetical protein
MSKIDSQIVTLLKNVLNFKEGGGSWLVNMYVEGGD